MVHGQFNSGTVKKLTSFIMVPLRKYRFFWQSTYIKYQCFNALLCANDNPVSKLRVSDDEINRFCGPNSDMSKCSKSNSNTHKYSQSILFIDPKQNTQILNKKPIHTLRIKATLRSRILDIRTKLSHTVIGKYIYDIIYNDDICEDIPNQFL